MKHRSTPRVAHSCIEHAGLNNLAETQGMNTRLAVLRAGLKAFRAEICGQFPETLGATQVNARTGGILEVHSGCHESGIHGRARLPEYSAYSRTIFDTATSTFRRAGR
jgi:hypothetical protein